LSEPRECSHRGVNVGGWPGGWGGEQTVLGGWVGGWLSG